MTVRFTLAAGCLDLADAIFQGFSARPVRSEADWQDWLAALLLACGLIRSPGRPR